MSSSSLLTRVGTHENKLRRYFKRFDFTADTEPCPHPVSILVFMNRSGSSLIAEYLRATGRFSGFGEPLSHGLTIERADEHGLASFEDYLRWLLDNVRQPDTHFGMKASLDQVLMLMRSGAIPRYFGEVNWIFVQRVDLVSQAISFFIAQQTQQWQSFEESNGREPAYNFKGIRERLFTISDTYSATLALLSLHGIRPYYLTYEQFLENPEAQTAALASYLGEENVNVDSARLRMEKQANQFNRDFRERFLADYARR